MTWVLKNGESSREFATKEEAEDAKAELAGLGTLSIEEIETENDNSDEIEADYVNMPYDDESGVADDDDENDRGGCPSCGAQPTLVYRCEFCGYDLAAASNDGVGTGAQ